MPENNESWVYKPGDKLEDLPLRGGTPQRANQQLQALARSYVSSTDYDGPPVTWIHTDKGIYPVGGFESLEPPLSSVDDNTSWNALQRKLSGHADTDYPGSDGWMTDYMLRSNNNTIPNDQVPAEFSGNYGEVTAPVPGDLETYAPFQDAAQTVYSGGSGYAPGAGPTGQTTGQPSAQSSPSLVDFSQQGVNPFAAKAKFMGFTDFQDTQAPSDLGNALRSQPSGYERGAVAPSAQSRYGDPSMGDRTPPPSSVAAPNYTNTGKLDATFQPSNTKNVANTNIGDALRTTNTGTPTSISSGSAPGYAGGGGRGSGPMISAGPTMGPSVIASTPGSRYADPTIGDRTAAKTAAQAAALRG